MQPAARAIAWEFRQRHRWGLLALAAYLLVIAVIKVKYVLSGQDIVIESAERFGLVVMGPLATTFTYFLAVFTFGVDGDLAARQSMYPPRMFTLPVTTNGLAGWPMLYGSCAIALLWLATRLFALWPSGVHVPLVWPGLLAASLLAWTQALTWMPYGLPGLRVIVCVLWLGTIDVLAMLALQYKTPEPIMLAVLAPQIPLAYLTARYGVARARRGDVPDWRGAFATRTAVSGADATTGFRSPQRAQAWFEWQRHGWALPALVGAVLPFELWVLYLVRNMPTGLLLDMMAFVLITPPFMAAFVAATVRVSTTFPMTRPLTTSALLSAKLKMAAWSTLSTWLLTLLALTATIMLSGSQDVFGAELRRLVSTFGEARAMLIASLTIALLVLATWKQLVQSLYIGVTGNEKLIKASVFAMLFVLTVAGPIINWILRERMLDELWDALPHILGVLAAMKMSIAVWVVVRLHRKQLLTDRAFILCAAVWTTAVFVLYGIFVWFFATSFVPHHVLALIAILLVPLARVSAAPLALAWNRHR